jgi:hypothetical protein
MPEERKYVKVFHADLISDYPDVWDDDAALATWLRLLVAADGSWPAPAELPRYVKDKPLASLTAAGLVVVERTHRFRIKGMDADRNARRNAASNAAASRWHSEGNAKDMPTKAEQSKPEQSSIAPATNDPFDDPEGEALTWLAVHGCDVRPGNGYHQKLVVAVEQHGSRAVIGMFDRLARAGTKQGDIKGFLFGAIDALNAGSRPNLAALEAEDREEERSASFAERARRTREQNAELAKMIEAATPKVSR